MEQIDGKICNPNNIATLEIKTLNLVKPISNSFFLPSSQNIKDMYIFTTFKIML